MARGEIIANNTLVMACQSCSNLSDNSVAFYRQMEDEWIRTDSISIGNHISGYDIDNFAVSDDGTSLGISLRNSIQSPGVEEDGAIIVLKKRNSQWHLALQVDSIFNLSFGATATYRLDFSNAGDLLVIANTNTRAGIYPNSFDINTTIYSYNDDSVRYQVMKEFKESVVSNAFLSLELMKNDKLIAISPSIAFNTTDQFIMYSLQDDDWQRDFTYQDTIYRAHASLISSDEEVKHIVASKSFALDSEEPSHITLYQRNHVTQNWESVANSYYTKRGFSVEDLSMSDKGDFVAVGFFFDDFIAPDTSSYVDYLKINDQGIFEPLYRFTFEKEDFPGKYGETGGIVDLSETGDLLMISRRCNNCSNQMYVYRISNLQGNSDDNNDMKIDVLYPNPTTGVVSIEDIEFDHLEIRNVSGQLITTFDTKGFDISEYPSGIYLVSFFLNNQHIATSKLVKM